LERTAEGVVGAGDEGAGLGGAAAAVLEESEAGGREGCRRRSENGEQEERASFHGLPSLSPAGAGLR
jgi:hypothetical protein